MTTNKIDLAKIPGLYAVPDLGAPYPATVDQGISALIPTNPPPWLSGGELSSPGEAIPDYHAPVALVPGELNPENIGSLQSLPDYHAPMALIPGELNPENIGSLQSLPDYHAGAAWIPTELNPQNLGSVESVPDYGIHGILEQEGSLASPSSSPSPQESLGVPGTEIPATPGWVPGLDNPLFTEEEGIALALKYLSDAKIPYLLDTQSDNPTPQAYSPTLVEEEGILPPSQSVEKSTKTQGLKPIPYVGAVPVSQVRADFPILSEVVDGGHQLVWFDNAATTQKPSQVIERLKYFYEHENSNVHRGAHALAARATDAYERARETVARYIGAKSASNIVFVRGTTEAINLVARSYVYPRLSPGDEIIITGLEHHANVVPWQVIASETGARLRIAPIDSDGQIIYPEYLKLFNPKTRFASVTHVSNALGTITPVASLVSGAHAHGVPVLVDAAQSISHLPINVSALGADFLVFSGHKIYGPTGIGALYGTDEALQDALPYQTGGNMIADVTYEKTVYHGPPQKFEAGTGNIADAVGLAAALEYVSSLGLGNIASYEESILRYATDLISQIPKVRIIGTAPTKASVISFVVEGKDNEEVGNRLSAAGIAVRAGHHCSQPTVRHFGLEGTVRASLAFYNTVDEIDYFVAILRDIAS